MRQTEFVSGFSDLKHLLIRTYKIERDQEFVRLYFFEKDNELLMSDYADHKKMISLCLNLKLKSIRDVLTPTAKLLVEKSLSHPSPSKFLNDEFKLYGFFRF